MSIDKLLADLGSIPVLTDRALVRQKSRDFYWYSPVLKRQLDKLSAEAVVLPRSEEEVVETIAAAVARRVPVTVRGAGTGNYGQAMPLRGGIVLDLSSLDQPIELRNGSATVQAGIKCIDLDAAATQAVGQEMRLHPSTRRTATVGGFIAGGSGGIGSLTWGLLRDTGNILSVRVVTAEDKPRVLELRGPDIQKVNHAYGTNGVITALSIPLAPAYPWVDVVVAFPGGLMDAVRFADGFAREDGIAKKLASVIASPVPQQYFKGLQDVVPEGASVALLMVAENAVEHVELLAAKGGGTVVLARPTAQAEVPLYEYTWNHTTLQALKVDRTVTYLQSLFPPPGHLALVEAMEARFGDEVPIHLEFVRYGGQVTCVGLQLVRFTTEERLDEIIRIHEDNGCPIFNPHRFTLEEGGMKRTDAVQLAWKHEADPHGLLNPGKMLGWDDPDWETKQGDRVALYQTAE